MEPQLQKHLICLNMIVRNEENNIIKCFDSIINLIDFYVISDTGSTDNTIAVIKNYFKEKGIDGFVFEDEWKDFSYNRNMALKHAKEVSNSDYLFIMDADDYLVNDRILKDYLVKDRILKDKDSIIKR